jgi:outer membrane protein assembly factor BamA
MKIAGILLLLSAMLFCGCSVTRRMEPDQYLLTRNRIVVHRPEKKARDERVAPDELAPYIRQRPNKRLFGIPFYLQIYNLSAPQRQNWTKRIGEPPVVYDPAQTVRSVDALSAYLHGHGFSRSSVTARVDTLARHRISVEYDVTTGRPWRVGTFRYDFRDAFAGPLVREDSAATLIRSGDIFNADRIQAERRRIVDGLKNQGFYDFSINTIVPVADTVTVPGTVNLVLQVRQRMTTAEGGERPTRENNRVYRLRNIYIRPDYDAARPAARLDTLEYRGVFFVFRRAMNVRPDVLMRAVNLYPNDLYDASAVARAYDNLMKLNYFRSANILFTELPDSLSTPISYVGDDGTGISTLESYLDCTIHCTPGTRQSYNVDVEATTASTYYGILATLGYQNRNLLRGAESIDFSTTFGYEFMRTEGRRNSIELGGSAGVTFPRFVAPLRIDRYNRLQNPRTRIELSVNYQDRPFYRRTLTSANWGYTWSNRKYSTFALRPIDIGVVSVGALDTLSGFYTSVLARNEYLRNSFESQLIAGISGSYLYNNQLKNVNRNAFRLRLNAETNGNLLNIVAPLFVDKSEGESYHRLFGIRYAQYVRADLDASYLYVLGAKTALASRFYIGAGEAYGNSAGSSIPFERQFYAGGPNSMRGWQVRTLGPGSSLADRYRAGGARDFYPAQVGNFKLEANLEFRFPVYKFLRGAMFADLGNIWLLGGGQADADSYFRFNRFYDQLGFNTGLGARFDFDFFLFRVDWGVRLHDPNKPSGQKWIHELTLRQTAFSFSVGYPF